MAYTPQTTGVITTPQQYNTSPVGYNPAYGGIPQLPAYTTDTTQQAGTDVQSQMIANLPNYQAMVGQATGNISDNLQGLVGKDVAANLGVQAAEFGAGAGQSLSQAAATNFLSRYGLTSNALQTQGQQQLLSQMQATPIQQTSTGQQTTDQAAAQAVYNSAPQPAAAAQAAMASAQGGINAGRGSIGGSSPTSPMAPTAGMGYGQGPTMSGAYYGTGIQQPASTATATPTVSNPYAGGDWTIGQQFGDNAFYGNMGNDWENLFGGTGTPSGNTFESDAQDIFGDLWS